MGNSCRDWEGRQGCRRCIRCCSTDCDSICLTRIRALARSLFLPLSLSASGCMVCLIPLASFSWILAAFSCSQPFGPFAWHLATVNWQKVPAASCLMPPSCCLLPPACRRCLLIMIIVVIMTIIKIMIMKISCAAAAFACLIGRFNC